MPRLIRHFRDRHKRPKRPKPKHRPPAPPGCRPIILVALNILALLHPASNYLDSRPACSQKSQQFNQPSPWLFVYATTVPSSTQGGTVYNDDDPPLEGEFLRAVCAALSRNAIGGLSSAANVLASIDSTPPIKSPKSGVLKSSSAALKEVERACA